MRRKQKLPKLDIDLTLITPVQNFETIELTDEVLKEYKLQVDKTKIENFKDINFISLFDE